MPRDTLPEVQARGRNSNITLISTLSVNHEEGIVVCVVLSGVDQYMYYSQGNA